jgi:hypothetical protein
MARLALQVLALREQREPRERRVVMARLALRARGRLEQLEQREVLVD